MAAKVELKSKVKKWITNHLILQLMSMTVKKSNQMRKMTPRMTPITGVMRVSGDSSVTSYCLINR